MTKTQKKCNFYIQWEECKLFQLFWKVCFSKFEDYNVVCVCVCVCVYYMTWITYVLYDLNHFHCFSALYTQWLASYPPTDSL
jgi:hypothetical protein